MPSGHRDLLARLDGLCSNLTEATPDHEAAFLLSEMHAALSAYFRREEQLIRQNRDTGFGELKVRHDGLLQEIRDLIEKPGKRTGPDFGPSLSARFHAWFERHARNGNGE
ncbi:MAG: hypothetical protein RIB59_00085 [Rhodospirillales bacterium]